LSVLAGTVAGVDFDAFYRAERKPLVRFVMFLGCADAGTAEDIAQTAFARAFTAWDTIRFPQAWVRKVARNEFLRHCRATIREISLEAAPARAGHVMPSQACASQPAMAQWSPPAGLGSSNVPQPRAAGATRKAPGE
jgi:DNA-directed RNA polymerase specialized sigma24 family protein